MKIKQEKHRIANKIAIHTMLDADIENQLLKNTSLVLGILGSSITIYGVMGRSR